MKGVQRMFVICGGVRNGPWVLAIPEIAVIATMAAIATIACAPPAEEIPPSSPETAGIPTAYLREIGLPTALPEEVGMSSQRLLQIDAVMQRYIDKGKIQGAVTAVARRGKVVHFKAHGLMDVEDELPMELDTMFRMASSSKPVLGVASMMAIEEGLFAPTDEVAMYLPEFKDMQVAVLAEPEDEDISPEWVTKDKVPEHRLVQAERPITIHHLLTHTSGLGGNGLGTAVAEHPPKLGPEDTLASAIPLYASMPLDFQPGTRWAYSAYVGLDVVARIIEVVSGMPYDEFVRERIFEPLGMTDTHFSLPPEKESRLVVIHGLDDKAKGWDQPSRYVSASGGLFSTAADFLRFEQMLVHQGTLFGNRIISPESVATMSSNQVGELYQGKGKQPGVGFGYAVEVVLDPAAANSERCLGSFGWGGAFGTVSWTDPTEEITAVLLVQQPTKEVPADFEKAIRQAIIE
jgi:CubicO group peptidase (beta-lactamase class C family)